MILLLALVLQLSFGCATILNPFQDLLSRESALNKLESCFCELHGKVEECCCDVETVDGLNEFQLYPLLTTLLSKPFFRYYRINLNRPCPFWSEDGQCVLRSCAVEECEEDSTPVYLWENESADLSLQQQQQSCSRVPPEVQVLSQVDTSISSEQQREFAHWEQHDHREERFCDPEDTDPSSLSYVDLEINPERFTGYSGPSAHRVWRAIYRENCFRPTQAEEQHAYIDRSELTSMCLEKRAFYRLISGLHASINTHLSALYVTSDKASSAQSRFGPNLGEFVRRFDSSTTDKQGPIWLKHLYFAYLLVLRAVMKAEQFWEQHSFFTGSPEEDRHLKEQVREVVKIAKSCPSLFDETQMFSGDSSDSLKAEFKSHFRNITQIMDCVGCDKCKLWGKLQVHGIGTALDILFAKPLNGQQQIVLSRSQVVALFNVLGRFSSSIHELHNFRKMLEEPNRE